MSVGRFALHLSFELLDASIELFMELSLSSMLSSEENSTPDLVGLFICVEDDVDFGWLLQFLF